METTNMKARIERGSSGSSTTATADSKSDNLGKHVAFSQIEVREFGMTLGDNPSVSSGVPITIDWEAQTTIIFDFDQFESVRQEPRDMRSLRLPSHVREDIAFNDGYSMQEVRAVIAEVKQIREMRRESVDKFRPTKKNFSFRNLFGGEDKKFKFASALAPEDYAMADLPDMTQLPISVSCDALKSIVKRDAREIILPADPSFTGSKFML